MCFTMDGVLSPGEDVDGPWLGESPIMHEGLRPVGLNRQPSGNVLAILQLLKE